MPLIRGRRSGLTAGERLCLRRRGVHAVILVEAEQPGEDPQRDLRRLDADSDAEPGYSDAKPERGQLTLTVVFMFTWT
jgi:hypothetical protein